MESTKEKLDKLVGDLKRQRDELKLQLHLAKADAKDQWAKLETKYEELKAKADKLGKEAGKSAETIGATLECAADEIKKEYERLRKQV